MLFASIVIMSFVFMKYKLVYGVKVDGEDSGYVASKIALERKIDDYVINGEGEENLGYVILNTNIDYKLMLVSKDISTSDSEIFARVKDESDVYYKVYAVLVDDNEKVRAGWNLGTTINANNDIMQELRQLLKECM